MKKLANRFRIGEKIVLGFGTIGLIFLGVIWYYHGSLRDMAAAYQDLSAIYGARQAQAFAIESRVSAMRSAADRFLLTRDLAFAEQTLEAAAALRTQTAELAQLNGDAARTAAAIDALAEDFTSRFQAIVEAWRNRGLDEDSGLQGAFRAAVHELQDRAAHYNVDRLYLLLLQVRRGEKDLGLRRDPRYREQVFALLEEMRAELAASGLREDTRRALSDEITAYRDRFAGYAERVLAGESSNGGMGPFRDRAHRIEDLLRAHYIPDLETTLLQMRRREKDYLLRGDATYIAAVDTLADAISARIADASVAPAQKSRLLSLLDDYSDFICQTKGE
ncbi:hypothetical protein [uncultured Thiohalocapsa sp.]|uniref:hypothetical protein n=1 Tax=uncultured Thiohalocapsa sp. TaxID=768990 RepID=UPI0025E6195A|nr:hypothetical protein [uncultured Thiohalocapsa sp.]